jgi:hypothetical protein
VHEPLKVNNLAVCSAVGFRGANPFMSKYLRVRGVIHNKLQTAHNSKTIENSKKSVKAKVVHKKI